MQVLSGGMGARLFTEVREKRGLCYSVGASYQTFKDRACILCYAGTTADRAQETLDVTLTSCAAWPTASPQEEVQRVQAGLKSSVIMQEESTSARAGALASDWYFLGRIRSLDEIHEAIDSLTPRRIVNHVRAISAAGFHDRHAGAQEAATAAGIQGAAECVISWWMSREMHDKIQPADNGLTKQRI